jgi:hypothetical protein
MARLPAKLPSNATGSVSSRTWRDAEASDHSHPIHVHFGHHIALSNEKGSNKTELVAVTGGSAGPSIFVA